ncbi:MAG TPA: pilus assembly protein TadG-related protein [Gaiellales bacterium]|nr:pilus assembly protein TadG-related protein [Gaiellales bacterium]
MLLQCSSVRRAGTRTARGTAGQTLPLVVLFMVGLLGMAGLVIDLGNGYLQQRSTQNVADAAALAGAAAIPTGNWQTAVSQNVAKNDRPGDQVSMSLSSANTVSVTVTRSSPTYILGLFGVHSISVSATAKATVEALSQVSGHVAPYAVSQASYANGTGTTLFDENAPGAYGTIDLPASGNTTGGSCSGSTNLGTPPNIKSELSGQLPTAPIVIGGCLSVKSGASQPSATVVNGLANGNNTMSSDLQSIGNGEYTVIPQSWDDASGLPPRLMAVPIVPSIPGGNGQTTIQSFAWFYVTGTTGQGSKLTIVGQWVSLELPDNGPTTQYVPGVKGQVLTVELTG